MIPISLFEKFSLAVKVLSIEVNLMTRHSCKANKLRNVNTIRRGTRNVAIQKNKQKKNKKKREFNNVRINIIVYNHTYSSTDSGMSVVLTMIPGVASEAFAVHVSNINMLIAKLSTVTKWFQTSLYNKTRENKWAGTSENIHLDMCAQRRYRSACTFTQSGQSVPGCCY